MIPIWHLVLPVYPDREPVPLAEAWRRHWENPQDGLADLVAALYQAGRYQEAATLISRPRDGVDPDTALAYVACLCQVSRTSVALAPTPWQELHLAFPEPPATQQYRLIRAGVLYRRNLPLAAKEALNLVADLEHPALAAASLTLQGLILVDEQRASDAIPLLAQAADLASGTADRLGAALNLAFAHLAARHRPGQADLDQALGLVDERLAEAAPGHPGRVAWAGLRSGLAATTTEQLALGWEALGGYRAVPGSARQQAICYRNLARAYRDLGQPERALAALRSATEVLATAEEYDALAEADLDLSDTMVCLGGSQPSAQVLDEAVDLAVPALVAQAARRFTIVGASARTAFRDGFTTAHLDRVLRLVQCRRPRLAAELIAWSRLTGRTDLAAGPLGAGSMLRPGPRLIFPWPGEITRYLEQAACRYALAPDQVEAPTALGLGVTAAPAAAPAQVRIRNRTASKIRLQSDGQEPLECEPEDPIRMPDEVVESEFLHYRGSRIELVTIEYGETEGLPDEVPGVYHVVGQPVAMRHPERRDLVFPRRAVNRAYASHLARLSRLPAEPDGGQASAAEQTSPD